MADNRLYVAAGDKQLSASISSTATTIALVDIDSRAGDALTMADFGTLGYATIDPNGVDMELISFTGISSTSLTGVTRGLSFEADYASVTALKNPHSGGTTVVFSNSPQFYDGLLNKNDDETIAGLYTFTNTAIPRLDTYVAPTNAAEFAPRQFVLDNASGASVSVDQVIPVATAGETVAAGEVCYFDTTANEWLLADSDVGAESDNVMLGIAQGAGTDGAAITGGILLLGLDENQTGMTAGDPMYLSSTSGAISSSAGTQEVEIGIAYSATQLYFKPRFASVPTGDEKDALAGDSGTPSADNLYVTELGLQRSVETYAVDAAGSDTYVVTLDPVPAGYVAGMTIKVLFGTLNTGAATINVNGLGAKSITKNGAIALQTGDILVNQVGVLVYDGTQFQLQSNSNSLLVNGGVVDSLHEHAALAGLNVAGTTFAYSVPMDSAQWTLTNCTITAGYAAYGFYQSSGAWIIQSYLPNANGDADNNLKWDQTKQITVEWRAQFLSGVTGDRHMGIGDVSVFDDAYTTTVRKVCFAADGGTLYAVTADGSTNNNTDISAGLTLTNWNTYKIVWTPGTNALFYVNGTLLATETANIPSGTNDCTIGFGGQATGEDIGIAGLHVIQTV